MKKNTWLAAILAACALLCACSHSSFAGEIPSAASGWYSAPDRVCRLVLADRQATHIAVDLFCVSDAGWPTSSGTLAEAPRPRCIGSPFVQNVFNFDGEDYGAGLVALDSFDGATLSVRVGFDPVALHTGGGVAQQWARIRELPSPTPYTCAAPASMQSAPPRSASMYCTVVNPSSRYCRGG